MVSAHEPTLSELWAASHARYYDEPEIVVLLETAGMSPEEAAEHRASRPAQRYPYRITLERLIAASRRPQRAQRAFWERCSKEDALSVM